MHINHFDILFKQILKVWSSLHFLMYTFGQKIILVDLSNKVATKELQVAIQI